MPLNTLYSTKTPLNTLYSTKTPSNTLYSTKTLLNTLVLWQSSGRVTQCQRGHPRPRRGGGRGALCEHLEPELRGPPGRRGAHAPRHGGREGACLRLTKTLLNTLKMTKTHSNTLYSTKTLLNTLKITKTLKIFKKREFFYVISCWIHVYTSEHCKHV